MKGIREQKSLMLESMRGLTGAKGNDGVTNMIKQTDGAIGYIELAYAIKNNLSTAALKNKVSSSSLQLMG